MFNYAQLDENRKVHTVCTLAGEVEDARLIRLENLDYSLLGKYHNPDTGEFESNG